MLLLELIQYMPLDRHQTETIAINLDYVSLISPKENSTTIMMSNGVTVNVVQDYDSIMLAIRTRSGFIDTKID